MVINDETDKFEPDARPIAYPAALAFAARYGLQREFAMSYRQARPWWAFWISEEDAVWSSLVDCDLQGGFE